MRIVSCHRSREYRVPCILQSIKAVYRKQIRWILDTDKCQQQHKYHPSSERKKVQRRHRSHHIGSSCKLFALYGPGPPRSAVSSAKLLHIAFRVMRRAGGRAQGTDEVMNNISQIVSRDLKGLKHILCPSYVAELVDSKLIVTTLTLSGTVWYCLVLSGTVCLSN